MQDAKMLSNARRMMEYSIKEITMAEKYMNLALSCDVATATKLQEIAKDEMKHFDILKQILDTTLQESEQSKDIKAELLSEVYNKWVTSVKMKISDFRAK